jgi:hypothetical protein
MTLREIGDKHQTDKCGGDPPNHPAIGAMKGAGYVDIYSNYFEPMRNDELKILEIGVLYGASIRTWREYFPNASIYGYDMFSDHSWSAETGKIITPHPIPDIPGTTLFRGDQGSRSDLQKFIDTYGGDFDIIIDDGGHAMDHQQISFGFLSQYLKPTGMYVIEDLITSLPHMVKGGDPKAANPNAVPGQPGYNWKKDLHSLNTTLTMLNTFRKTKKIESEYILPDEKEYIETNFKHLDMHPEHADTWMDWSPTWGWGTEGQEESAMICFIY